MLQPTPRLIFENNAGQLATDPAGFLRIIWNGNARTIADTHQLFEQMRQALQQHSWSRVLVNQSAMTPFSTAEQQWITREWLPLAVEAGYRHGAVVLSPDVFVRLATAYITTHVPDLPLTYRSFDAEADALQWLLQQPAAPPR